MRINAHRNDPLNEVAVSPAGSFDWPQDAFEKLRDTFGGSYSHDRSRVFLFTVPQGIKAVAYLKGVGHQVTTASNSDTRQAAPKGPKGPLECAGCGQPYRSSTQLFSGKTCTSCSEPLVLMQPHQCDQGCRERRAKATPSRPTEAVA